MCLLCVHCSIRSTSLTASEQQQALPSAEHLLRIPHDSPRASSCSAVAACPLRELLARHAARRGTQAVSELRWH